MHLRLLREFEGMDGEKVLGCVGMTAEGKIVKTNAELYSPEGPAYADNAYRMRMPDSGQEMITFIEGQRWIGNWKYLYDRMLIYGFRFLDAELRTSHKGERANNLPLVRGIIVVFNPPKKHMNTVFETWVTSNYGTSISQPSNPVRLTFLFLGMAGDLLGTDIGGLNLLYARGLSKEERNKHLWEGYKIDLNVLIGKREDGIMNIGASFKYAGREEGREEMAEYMTDAIAKIVFNFVKESGMSIKEAMAHLGTPEEYADAIENKALKLMADNKQTENRNLQTYRL
jgi:hypothetical protein